jgi:trans-2,3-dihydro-3-hydroxyanthranilate isomerase
MLCIENNQLIEDAAQVVQAVACKLSLKYHTPVIEIINNQGEFINRPSQFFQWKIMDGHFDIKIGGKHNSLQKEWETE